MFEYIRAVCHPKCYKDGAICNREEKPGSDVDFFRGDATIYIHTTTFASNEIPLAAKWDPGRPRKVRRQEDWTQLWYDAVESEQ